MKEEEVLTNVPPQYGLNLLLLEPALNDQSLSAVDGPICTQFGEEELNNVFGLPVHPLAYVRDVRENGLLVAFTMD